MDVNPAELAGRPVIVGAGLAGLVTALQLAPRPVVVLTKSVLGDGIASGWSQGGLAAAVMPDDSPALHAADTMAAGDGLNDADIVRHITAAGPEAVALLERYGVRFARDARGAFACKLEAAHSRRRVVNIGGDATGAEIMKAIVATVRRTPSITVLEGVAALELLVCDGGVEGVGVDAGYALASRAVVLATGGAGGLWLHSTNPSGALGQGLALAARAGAAMADLEFMQFHPTALDVGRDPMTLASEALRGDGAILINDLGERFMAGQGRAELEPRDVVSRAVWAQLASGRKVFLDTRQAMGADVVRRFPVIAAACLAAGIDPATQPIPIHPAAHYHMGGIAVNVNGRTSLDGLWACGEVGSTGLHGANRLASNSLLEAVVTGCDVARDIAGLTLTLPRARDWRKPSVTADPAGLAALRSAMTAHVGVLRDDAGLRQSLAKLLPLARTTGAARDPAIAALMIAAAAWRRRESRGGHARTDFPEHDPTQSERRMLRLDAAFEIAAAEGAAP